MDGGLAELSFSDDQYSSWRPGFILNDCPEMPVWLFVDFMLDTDQPQQLFVTYETHANTPNIFLALQGFDWTTSRYFDILDLVPCQQGSDPVPFGFDAVRVVDLTKDIDVLVEPGTAFVQLRFGWNRTGFTIAFPWQLNIDQIALSR